MQMGTVNNLVHGVFECSAFGCVDPRLLSCRRCRRRGWSDCDNPLRGGCKQPSVEHDGADDAEANRDAGIELKKRSTVFPLVDIGSRVEAKRVWVRWCGD